jgi:hypothetical protein
MINEFVYPFGNSLVLIWLIIYSIMILLYHTDQDQVHIKRNVQAIWGILYSLYNVIIK